MTDGTPIILATPAMSLSLALSALLLFSQPQQADSVSARLQSIADSVLSARPRVPGILINVQSTRRNKSWSVAAGMSDTALKAALKPDQPIRIASVTKSYTAATILRLVERGVIKLNDPVSKHLPPEFSALLERDGYRTDSITVEQVLSHRSGLDEHTAVRSYIPMVRTAPSHRWTRVEQVTWLVDSLQPIGKPNEKFKYSDTGYILLGAIIERHAGKNYGAAARELIGFDKLGLKSTWFETLEAAPTNISPRAHQYMSGNDTYNLDPSFDLYGGGGVATTTADMSTFFSALIGGEVFDKKATLDTMMAVRPAMLDGYGFGLFRLNSNGTLGYGHSGFWGVLSVHYPSEGITVSVSVTEQSQGNAVYGIATAVLNAMKETLRTN